MTNRSLFAYGVGLGATAMYFLDPNRGARRRAMVRDTATRTTTLAKRNAGKVGRDVWHRTSGTAAAMRHLVAPRPADDSVLEGRIRSKLGRLVSHPHAVRVEVLDGVATLSGPILTREADRLIRTTARIQGVCDVNDRLERHDQAGDVPSLQGGRAPVGNRPDVLQQHWAPATRSAAAIAGALLIAVAARRRDRVGAAALAAGSGLLARAAGNLPLGRLAGLTGGRRVVDVQKTITIDAPVSDVYAFWRSFENFPRFMSRVLEVQPTALEGQSHWTVAGPAGTPVEFDAEVTRAIPNEYLGWRTVPGSTVAHAGIVHFEPDGDGRTRVQVRMSYNPPAGWLGHGVATLLGVDPKRSMDEDLVRMKTLIETGRTPRDAAQPPSSQPAGSLNAG